MRSAAIALLFALLTSSAAHAEKRIALLIGNKDYKPGVGALVNPLNDIRIVGAALKKVRFEVLQPVQNATRSTMLLAINDFAAKLKEAGPDAVGFLYYSGHGVASEGENYLIPTDIEQPSTRLLRVQGVRQSEILAILRNEAPNAAHYLVLDACRNTLKGTRGGKGFVPAGQQSGVLLAFAAEPGKTASDAGGRSGPYAAALAAELVKPGQNDLLMFHHVRVAVMDKTDGDQVPWTEDGIQRRQRVMFGDAAPFFVPGTSQAAGEWARVDKTNIAELETFVRRHGNSPEADYARARIGELKKQQIAAAAPLAAANPALPGPSGIKPGEGRTKWFKDCAECPEMVIVPASGFTIGSSEGELERKPGEDLVPVRIARPFAVGRFAVTRREYAAFVAATEHRTEAGCFTYALTEWKQHADRSWQSPGYSQDDEHPVVCVSWNDAKAYTAWLSSKTRKTYRLLSEAERELVTRAGTATPFWWGTSISTRQANYDGRYTYAGGAVGESRQGTVPVSAFEPNPWGLFNVHGNVWDWTEDCGNASNAGIPDDGSARLTGDCSRRMIRGGSWTNIPANLRSANRGWVQYGARIHDVGFRVARALD